MNISNSAEKLLESFELIINHNFEELFITIDRTQMTSPYVSCKYDRNLFLYHVGIFKT